MLSRFRHLTPAFLLLFAAVTITASARPTQTASETASTTTVATAPTTRPAALKVGDLAPDFVLNDLAGEPRRLSENGAEKALVVVFFRGAW